MEIGHVWPASTWYQVMTPAALVTCGAGRVSTHGAACSPASTAAPIRSWYAGWYWTTSRRCP